MFGERIFVVAGSYDTEYRTGEKTYPRRRSINEVWSTTDPEDVNGWSMSKAPWAPRLWPSVATLGRYLYVIGGYDNQNGHNLSDIWRTRNGSDWEEVTPVESIAARHAASLFPRGKNLILVAGNTSVGSYVQSDIWELTGLPD